MNAYILNVDYVCSIGGTFDQDITIELLSGEIFDLSDYSAECDIKQGSEIKASMTCTILGDTLKLFMTPAQTKLFERGNYDYDVKLTNLNDVNDVLYPVGGEIHFEAVVTE